jgi:DNA N-6-adenine-methyltransferase (Dam)
MTRPMVYFQETPDGFVWVGHSDQPARRDRSHAYDGKKLIAARPGTGQGTGTDENRLHEFFKCDLIPGRGKSTYGGDRIWEYIEWLLARGYAARTYKEADNLAALPYEVWCPEKTGDAFTEPNGQGLLVGGLTRRERVEFASSLVHLMSKSDQWLTPAQVIDAARRALGGRITTDPASCMQADAWIDADTWYSIDHDGLHPDHPWHGTVWLNPPYGRGDHSAGAFIARLVAELQAGTVTAAITCLNVNSIGSLWFRNVWDHAAVHLVWRGRIDFIKPAGDDDSSPSKGTILSYFGPDPDAFRREFSQFGELVQRLPATLEVAP